MYIIDLAKSLKNKGKIPVIIYLILNVFVIGAVLNLIGAGTSSFWSSLLIGLILYAISLLIALSPAGEGLLRFQTGCRRIKREDQRRFIEPIFREVYEKAKAKSPSISNNVQLFICKDEDPNAFATGRKTICITRGLLELPVDQIKATLAHEFGHLANKDTDLLLVVTVGNFIVTAVVTFFKLCLTIAGIIMAIISDTLSEALMAFFSVILVNLIMWIWTKIGTVLVLKSCRENEYNADDFAFELGYGSSLCAMLSSVDHGGAKGLFATLISTHPDSDERIARLQQRGAVYWINYGEDQTFCPICGTRYVPEAGFCTECGHRRDQAAY